MKKEIFKKAFVKSLPIMCSYLFVSMAYGIMMEEAGFGWYDSLFISMNPLPVFIDYIIKQQCIYDYDSSGGALDEQPPDLLQSDVCP